MWKPETGRPPVRCFLPQLTSASTASAGISSATKSRIRSSLSTVPGAFTCPCDDSPTIGGRGGARPPSRDPGSCLGRREARCARVLSPSGPTAWTKTSPTGFSSVPPSRSRDAGDGHTEIDTQSRTRAVRHRGGHFRRDCSVRRDQLLRDSEAPFLHVVRICDHAIRGRRRSPPVWPSASPRPSRPCTTPQCRASDRAPYRGRARSPRSSARPRRRDACRARSAATRQWRRHAPPRSARRTRSTWISNSRAQIVDLHSVTFASRRCERLRDGRLRRAEEAQHVMRPRPGLARARGARRSVSSARGQRRCSSRGGPGRHDDDAWCRGRARGRARCRRDPSETEPSGRVACLRTPVAKSAYGRPSRSAIVREMLSICASSSSSTNERPTRDARDELDRAVVVRRPEPAGDEAEVGLERLAEGVLEVFDAVADDRDRRRLETEAHGLGREEGPVAVLALAADELRRPSRRSPREGGSRGGPDDPLRGHDERRALGELDAVPVEANDDVRAASRARAGGSAPRTTSADPARASRCRGACPADEVSRTSIHELAVARAHGEPCSALRTRASRRSVGDPVWSPWHVLALRAAELPRRDHERGRDRDRDERDARRSATRVARRSRVGGGTRRARSGASSSPTVKRELYSSTNGCPSSPSASA